MGRNWLCLENLGEASEMRWVAAWSLTLGVSKLRAREWLKHLQDEQLGSSVRFCTVGTHRRGKSLSWGWVGGVCLESDTSFET